MFIQFIRGKAKDVAGLRARADAWDRDLKPGATGFLGATQGITGDGVFVTVARFESEEAARRNSDRPEQGAWWEETSKLLEGVEFIDCPRAELFLGGGSDDAGFVQIMLGRTDDVEDHIAINRELEKQLPAHRPDLIGGTLAFAPDGRFVDASYFTSEAEARTGEKKARPPELERLFDRFSPQIAEYIDLRDPWLYSP